MYPAQMYPLLQSNLVVQTPTTAGHVDPSPSIEPSGPTTPGQFDMWQNADVPRSDVTPLTQWNLVVQSPPTQGQFAMGKMQMYPGQMYPLPQWNLVLQSPTTPGQFDM